MANYSFEGKKALVTGASGFKGAWMCAILKQLGAHVYGTVRSHRHPHSAYNVLQLDDKINAYSLDITNRQAVTDALNTIAPDHIIHMAAQAIVPDAKRDPARAFEVNVIGTSNLLDTVRQLRLRSTILVVSTDHVFGNIDPADLPERGFNESSKVSYGSPYDSSKAAMELIVRTYNSTYWNELPHVAITRCANVFGAGDVSPRRVIPLFTQSALQNGAIPLKYRFNGRQFIHITGAIPAYVRAVAFLATEDASSRPTRSPFTPTFHFSIEKYLNTNSNPYIRMADLAELVATIFKSRVVETPDCVDFAPDENRVQALDCTETRRILKWENATSLEDGLSSLGEWYMSIDSPSALKNIAEKELQSIIAKI